MNMQNEENSFYIVCFLNQFYPVLFREPSDSSSCRSAPRNNTDNLFQPWRDFTFHIPYDSPDLCRLRDVISAKCDHMVDITRRGRVKGDDSGMLFQFLAGLPSL